MVSLAALLVSSPNSCTDVEKCTDVQKEQGREEKMHKVTQVLLLSDGDSLAVRIKRASNGSH